MADQEYVPYSLSFREGVFSEVRQEVPDLWEVLRRTSLGNALPVGETYPPLGTREKGGKGNAMPYLLVRHKVEDYERWKPVFDEHGDVREENGSKGGRLFRNPDNPRATLILLEWDDLAKGRTFAESQDLRETMLRAGGAEPPDIYFLGRGRTSAGVSA